MKRIISLTAVIGMIAFPCTAMAFDPNDVPMPSETSWNEPAESFDMDFTLPDEIFDEAEFDLGTDDVPSLPSGIMTYGGNDRNSNFTWDDHTGEPVRTDGFVYAEVDFGNNRVTRFDAGFEGDDQNTLALRKGNPEFGIPNQELFIMPVDGDFHGQIGVVGTDYNADVMGFFGDDNNVMMGEINAYGVHFEPVGSGGFVADRNAIK